MLSFPYQDETARGPAAALDAFGGHGSLATVLGISLQSATGHVVRWRGQTYPLRFGDVKLELSDDTGAVWQWTAVISFSPAPMRYPILGTCGCLQFFDAWFRGDDRIVDIETNPSYPGTKT